MTLTRTRVAYHEAGHAVACLASGIDFVSVTSIPAAKGPAGCLRLVPGQQADGDLQFAWVTSGGVIADRIKRRRDDFTVNTVRNWRRYGWLEPDIHTLIEEFPDSDRLLTLIHSSADLTRANWPAVEAIASVLTYPVTLAFDDARQLYLHATAGTREAREAGT
jgi:hypothetical protein